MTSGFCLLILSLNQCGYTGSEVAGTQAGSRIWWDIPCIPEFRKCRKEDEDFKVILGHTVCTRPAWTLGDLLFNINMESLYS